MSSIRYVCCLNSDAGCIKRNLAPLFSPIFSGKAEKMGPSETFQRTPPRQCRWLERKKRALRIRAIALRWLVLLWPLLTRRRRLNKITDFQKRTVQHRTLLTHALSSKRAMSPFFFRQNQIEQHRHQCRNDNRRLAKNHRHCLRELGQRRTRLRHAHAERC